jgi:hypothetical protein
VVNLYTRCDHRKVSVREYVEGMRNALSILTGQTIEALDDDRPIKVFERKYGTRLKMT